MIGGIRSLAAHHRLHRRPTAPLSSSTASLPPPSTPQPIPRESVTEEERAKLEEALGMYRPAESDPTTIAIRCMCRCGSRTLASMIWVLQPERVRLSIALLCGRTLLLPSCVRWQCCASLSPLAPLPLPPLGGHRLRGHLPRDPLRRVRRRQPGLCRAHQECVEGRPHLHPLLLLPRLPRQPRLLRLRSASSSRRARLARHRPLCAHVTRRS
ncbi:hypothetical protein B0H16DRAFT_414618 [Mycena metata]|uniref:Uncharacterized protein n=1 Tax=Mycena metata TaxID=1033252 RepID=A0AAD7JHW3_9AGAR|nr:hypothetical protein B0H16DRAFT_414618 [Mycena metata]